MVGGKQWPQFLSVVCYSNTPLTTENLNYSQKQRYLENKDKSRNAFASYDMLHLNVCILCCREITAPSRCTLLSSTETP